MPQPLVNTAASLPSGTDATPDKYVINLDDGTTIKSTFEDLTKTSKSDTPPSPHEPASTTFEGLPLFLHDESKVTIAVDGAFVKGYIHFAPESGFHFSICRNLCSKNIARLIPLPNFK